MVEPKSSKKSTELSILLYFWRIKPSGHSRFSVDFQWFSALKKRNVETVTLFRRRFFFSTKFSTLLEATLSRPKLSAREKYVPFGFRITLILCTTICRFLLMFYDLYFGKVSSCVRQGCVMSPQLFIILLEVVMYYVTFDTTIGIYIERHLN